MIVICDYETQVRQIKFMQGNVIGLEYTINETHAATTQNLKTIQEHLHNAHRQNLNQHITIIKSFDTDLNSRLTKALFN